ncbi:hypothetical protein V2A60_004400 [Cordyceps javanica]|uniref:Regulator of chromosome condensation n=1 Tax=Cordyceps javanica TaxID=43265 RepID=A0A545URM0_9HYPO|nr:regulator of chromosome condensation [Cordyceps javanica]TQW04112.1 regulator of chromosome condensation [Cordyceps javanica]
MESRRRAPVSASRKTAPQRVTATTKATPKAKPVKRNGKVPAEAPAPAPASRKRKPAPSEARRGRASAAKPAPPQPRPVKRTKTSRAEKGRDSPAVINQRANEAVSVFVFGGGDSGELGLGPKRTETARPLKNPFLDPGQKSTLHVTDIACGGMHTVALTVDNQIVTWGVNDNMALGRKTEWDGGLRDLDDESDSEAGELNPFESTPTAIPPEHFAPGTVFVSVAAGDSCSFALTNTGLVYGWGTFRDPEGNDSFGYSADGAVVEKQATPVLVQGLEKITQIACGANHAFALDARGYIWGWGCGRQNQFLRRVFGRHQDTLRPQVVRACRGTTRYVACGEYHCFAVDRSDNVWGWGLNGYGEAGDASTAGGDAAFVARAVKIPALCGRGVTLLAGGAHHSAALTADGDCLVWGRLDGGQLGLGLGTGTGIGIGLSAEQVADARHVRCDERGRPRICLVPTVVPGLGAAVSHVACGTEHTIFVTAQGRAFATGFNSSGQLGLGTDEDAEVPRQIGGKHVEGRTLVWAGAGGQFSVVAANAG